MTDWAKDDLMDPPYADEEFAPRRDGRSRVMRHVIALLLVLIALGGLAYVAWYGYQTWRERGGEGLAPLIQADAGPTRVPPEQPGGIVIPNQERLILNDLDGGGATIAAERLLPPPEEPMARPVAAPAVAEAPTYAAAADATAAIQTAAVIAPEPAPAPVVVTPTAVAERDAEVKVPTTAAVAQVAEPLPDLIIAPAAQTVPLAPEPVPVSSLLRSHRVQLAAVDSEDSARRAWLRYQGLYQDLLGDLNLLVQRVEVNNRTYFRVQGGPLESATARRICQTIKNRGADCLVVRP